MQNKERFEIIQPKPFEQVGSEFFLSGQIPKSWLRTSWGGMDYRVLGSFLDINGFMFAGTVQADIRPNLLARLKNRFYFSTKVQFNQCNEPFIAKSQGRIVLKLYGQNDSFYLPLVVKSFEPEGGVDPKIEEEHKNIGQKIMQYEIDLKNYDRELEEIRKNIVYDKKILEGIFEIIEKTKENFMSFSDSDENIQEKKLEEKYKDAIKWRGQLFRGIAGRMEGFEFRVYSGDHNPKHFHIIHKGRGVNARFSFPEIKLINYKGQSNVIGKKENDRICKFFGITVNFQKLDNEFQKQLS